MHDTPTTAGDGQAPRPWPTALPRPITVTYQLWTGENTDEVVQFLGDSYDGVAEINGLRFLSYASPGGLTAAEPGTVFVRDVDNHIQAFPAADFERLYDTDTVVKGADIEIIERAAGQVDPRVILPDDIRINGRSVLAPSDAPVRVHDITMNHDELVQVTLTLFARRVTIGHEQPA
ncbi:hypothetical protein [Actinomadura violacea]|uniref:Uncharacterized protein n=1 Tax=Actinomadura violacea TaxID=2819934 RepID=A0ABS3RWM4_9ACTN|nr:hypothetical protein [Actinomadura violacea]MBO2461150.1 hypothetical protein [Actinomadura violacea]